MFSKNVSVTAMIAALIGALMLPAFAPAVSAQTQSYRMDNGMEVILKENHASPMIASIVFVRSGSKYESEQENGITHFLEHLLFDGTVNLDREGLDRSIQDLGGYINAFTRKEMTAYLVLMPSQYIDYGLTVQADMLFNSIFPEVELEKERKVVIEEINRDMDQPSYAVDEFFTRAAYAGTAYDRPVLGYRAFIESIPREAIIDYWKRYYTPSRMTALIIGDFEPDTMKRTMASVFGRITDSVAAAVPSTTLPPGHESLAESGAPSRDRLAGQHVRDTVADVTSTYVNFSVAAPHFTDSSYLPFDLLTQYVGLEATSPLVRALKGGTKPLATEVSIGLVTREEFSRMEVSIIADDPRDADAIVDTVIGQLKQMANHAADPQTVRGIKTSVKCDDIYYSEKLHLYSFIIAPMMMSTGWDFVEKYPERLERVSWSNCQDAARKWLSEPDYVATVVRPVGESGAPAYKPAAMSAEEIKVYFDTAAFPARDLTSGYALDWPETDSVRLELVDHATYHREVLPNGLTVLIKSSPDSRVFAMMVLGRNRTANEPADKTGITDFVNHCLEKGTVTRDARELSRDLAAIGANTTLYDNPWIPMDDRYTSRRFAFLKFETIDEFAPKGFHLFTEMVLHPAFDSQAVASVRRSLLGMLGRNAGSPSKTARSLFFQSLFDGKEYALSIDGDMASITSITLDDLREHHARFYSPENMILAIGTSRPTDTVMDWVNRSFGRLAATGFQSATATPPDPIHGVDSVHKDLESEQVSIYIGNTLPGADSEELAAITLATSILSSRLYLNLREKQGLAYSVGSGSVFDNGFGWSYSVIGTAAENYRRAVDGILLEIEKLKLDGPTQSELVGARNQLWGRLTRAKLSRINQMYYLAVDEHLGREPGYDGTFVKVLADVTPDAIRRAMARHFRTDSYVLASAGRLL